MNELFEQLLENGVFTKAIFETIYMTFISTIIAYVIGLPLGVILNVTSDTGISPNKVVNKILGFIVNLLRSIPFLILMVAMFPVAKIIVGTSIGNKAMIVMLIIAAFPYVARMVEQSLKELDQGKIEAARSMGASDMQIIIKVILRESIPSLVNGAIISTITILGYTAMASTIGAGGLGKIAITYGYQRFNNLIIWVCVALLVIIVAILQEIGIILVKKTNKKIKR